MFLTDVDNQVIKDVIEEALKGNLIISTVNLIILVTCILTLIYLFFAHMRSKKQVKRARQEISKMTDHVSCGVIILDFDNLKITYSNIGFYKMTGFTKDEVERIHNNDFFSFVSGVDENDFKVQLLRGSAVNQRFQLNCKDKIIWVHLTGSVTSSKKKKTLYCVIIDIDDSVRYEESIKLKEERYRIASDVTCDILFEYDIELDKMVFSERYYEIFGRSEIINDFCRSLPKSPNIYKDDLNRVCQFVEQMKNEILIQSEFRVRDASGNFVWVQFKGRKVKGVDDTYKKIYGKIVNVNTVKNELEALKQKSEIDSLTGLLNKESIKITILENLKSGYFTYYALFVIDIDNFKMVNDTLGHQYGDYVLTDVAGKLKKNCQKDLILGRIGGDEFLGFMPAASRESAELVAQNILRILYDNYTNGDKTCKVSASIGVALSSSGLDYEEVFKKADNALYTSKGKGKNSYTILN